MIQISAVIITLNEERNIKRCLESIKDVVDEIVVIDSFSTDKTKEICESYKALFIENKFQGYSAQKNFGIKKAKYQYILSLDADEELSDELKKSILAVKSNWKYDAYSFNRLSNYCGKWIKYGGWYPDQKIRLWDSKKGNWGGFKVHEELIFNKRITTKHLKGDLLHYTYYSIDEHVIQTNKYSTILASSYYENGRSITFMGILIRSIWRFLRDYIIKVGFLSGLSGLIIAVISSTEVFLKYIKLKKLIAKPFLPDKKNVCFLNSNKVWGGGEKWTIDIALHLSKLGYNVLIITNKNSDLFNEVRKHDSELELKSLTVKSFSFFNFYRRNRLKRILKAFNTGILFLNLSNDLKFGANAAHKLGVNKIIYRRAIPKPIERRWYYKYLLTNCINTVITNSEHSKKGILLNYSDIIKDDFVKVIYNGIEINKQGEACKKLPDDKIIIGSAGRLSKEKGHHYLVLMAQKLKATGIPFKIIIAGEGPQRKKIESDIEKYGLTDDFKLIGFVEDMRKFYNHIHVFVLPSIWEGFGFVLLEAMNFKLPVIAFDTGSSSEIIENQKSGFIIPDYNVDILTKKIIELYKDKELQKQMGETGYKILQDKFSVERTLNEFMKVIET